MTDDDIAKLVLSAPPVSLTDKEESTATYTVRLRTQPTGNVTVAVASSDVEAATVAPTSLPFTTGDWDISQTVTVTGEPDNVDNPGRSRPVTITHTAAGYANDVKFNMPVTDDDTTGLIFSRPSVSVTDKEESTATYTVRLRTQPTGKRDRGCGEQ